MLSIIVLQVQSTGTAIFDAGIRLGSGSVAAICYQLIVPMAMIITVAGVIYQGLFNSIDGIRYDFMPVFRGFFIMAIIAGYVELGPMLRLFLDTIGQRVSQITSVNDIAYSMANVQSNMNHAKASITGTTQLAASGNTGGGSPFSLTSVLMSCIVDFGMSGVRSFVMMFRDVVVSFLYIVGPIALSFSIIPAFKSMAMQWLQSLISAQFWYLTMGVLDILMKIYLQAGPLKNLAATPPAATDTNFQIASGGTAYIIQNLVIIICYIITPFLTSLYIGNTVSGAFASKVIGTAVTVASAGSGAIAAAGKAGASGAAGAAGAAGSSGTTASGASAAGSASTNNSGTGSGNVGFTTRSLQDEKQ